MLQSLRVLPFQLTSDENKRVGDFWNFIARIFPFNLMVVGGENLSELHFSCVPSMLCCSICASNLNTLQATAAVAVGAHDHDSLQNGSVHMRCCTFVITINASNKNVYG